MPACGLFLGFDSRNAAAFGHSRLIAEAALEGFSMGRQLSCSWSAEGWMSSKVFLGTDLEDNSAAPFLETAAESDAFSAFLLR